VVRNRTPGGVRGRGKQFPQPTRSPGMGVNLVVRVHYRRGSTSLLAKGKGAHREVGSEGSRRQSHGPMDKNPIRGLTIRMSWRNTAKSQAAKGWWSIWGGRGVKVNVLTRGGLPEEPGKAGNPCWKARLNRQESAEGIVPVSEGRCMVRLVRHCQTKGAVNG